MSRMEVSGPAPGRQPGSVWPTRTHSAQTVSAVPASTLPLPTEDEDDEDEPRLLIADDVFESSPASPPSPTSSSHPSTRGTLPPKSYSLDDRGSVRGVTPSRNEEAIESLLLLGQCPIIGPPPLKERSVSMSGAWPERRYSSGSGDFRLESRSDPGAAPSQTHPAHRLAPLPSVNPPVSHRRSSSFSSEGTPRAPGGDERTAATYYQRMRERNNEASKRCRLKRRLKAESLETQADILNTTNRYLKHRILKLERVSQLMKEGVLQAKSGACQCSDIVAKAKQLQFEIPEPHGLSTSALIESSRSYRIQIIDVAHILHGSSEEDITSVGLDPALRTHSEMPLTPPNSSSDCHLHPTSPKVSVGVMSEIQRSSVARIPSASLSSPVVYLKSPPNAKRILTDPKCPAPEPTLAMDTPPLSAPVNLIKLNSNTTLSSSATITPVPTQSNGPSTPTIMQFQNQMQSLPQQQQQQQQHLILLSPPAKKRLSSNFSSGIEAIKTSGEVQIKCEPEIQILECESKSVGTDNQFSSHETGVDPTQVCVAAGHDPGQCRGEIINLNRLTTHLDLVTLKPSQNLGSAAMERAILRSRLKIPFFKADEHPTLICEKHRYDLVHNQPVNVCAHCSKKRSKKPSSPQGTMWTITYIMSLQHATRTGNTLPIGMAVCGNCKDKHLKEIDFGDSRQLEADVQARTEAVGPSLSSIVSNARVSITSVVPDSYELSRKSPLKFSMTSAPISNSSVTISRAKTSGNSIEIKCIEQLPKSPVQSHITLPVPPPKNAPFGSTSTSPISATTYPTNSSLDRSSHDTTASNESHLDSPAINKANIFAKIVNLNEALKSINPQYKPTGFSITSIESCSPAILEDALLATETAVSTILSVIAPGQETYLWNAIKPKLNAKFLARDESNLNAKADDQ
ncbi:uncharacterized protein LOC131890048 [Tigriopus californicus]|uniref:uncharacterized protein LOC131890048 n=1 Tax=Tigriopus californicus TaxID=6832 RepID=UPI0027DA53DA|nr:uncharacterized protein LOC131890048 [Tigriopus californicus]XP_059095303.1 uncharacterized protein LOC131890048 [Tigriopus californicus]